MPEQEIDLTEIKAEWTELIRACIADIADEYRTSGQEPDDETPAMDITIGYTPETEEYPASWGFQTGDNSYTGQAYSHPHWAVVTLYRDSNPCEVAEEIAEQLLDLIHS